ncbi:MAG: phosphate ABC transporter ATP-binding protein PstB [Bryobacteraceae bacterium]|jgi:phosphate transport system ATP-binding protein
MNTIMGAIPQPGITTRSEQTVADSTSPAPTARAGPKLRASNVDFFYGKYQALHNISIDFPENQITALIGPSGCGKSTFLRTLNRINDTIRGSRVTGEVVMDGLSIMHVDVTELRRRVGMVFQRPNPFPKSIFDNIAYGVRINGLAHRNEIHEVVERSLRRAALWDEVKDKLNKSAYALSGGQQQRLCIARALAVDPEVLLLDEPCSALDPIATSKIEELLLSIKDTCTLIIVTHNMQQAARVADLTGFFLMGKLIEFNKTDIIFKTPARRETEDYITGRFG